MAVFLRRVVKKTDNSGVHGGVSLNFLKEGLPRITGSDYHNGFAWKSRGSPYGFTYVPQNRIKSSDEQEGQKTVQNHDAPRRHEVTPEDKVGANGCCRSEG